MEIELKYAGYSEQQNKMAESIATQHAQTDISSILNDEEMLKQLKERISIEDFERLTKAQPQTLAAAVRAGLKQTAITHLYFAIKKGFPRRQLEASDNLF